MQRRVLSVAATVGRRHRYIHASSTTMNMSTNTKTDTTSSSSNGGVDDGCNTTTTCNNINNISPGHEVITEGSITMHYPKHENSVFYNPVQVQNRDLSILMLGMYAERRTERLWTMHKRKEVRKALMEKEEQEKKGGEKQQKETKEERKTRLEQFELNIDAQVEHERSLVNFTELTKNLELQGDEEDLSSRSSNNNNNNNNNMISGMSIFEALAASGLRSLRYWKEVPGVRTIVINDLDPVAVDMARENVIRNGLVNDLIGGESANSNNSALGVVNEQEQLNNNFHIRPRGIQLQVGDATHEMYVSRRPPKLYPNQCNPSQLLMKPQYDVIDLDPYGSAAPFIDAAMQSIVNGGLLAVTCTDMAALGGSHPETCYGRYGAFPLQRAGYLQELALRILLYHMSVVAARYGRTIKPILSVGMAFYCRVFVEVYDDKAGVRCVSVCVYVYVCFIMHIYAHFIMTRLL